VSRLGIFDIGAKKGAFSILRTKAVRRRIQFVSIPPNRKGKKNYKRVLLKTDYGLPAGVLDGSGPDGSDGDGTPGNPNVVAGGAAGVDQSGNTTTVNMGSPQSLP